MYHVPAGAARLLGNLFPPRVQLLDVLAHRSRMYNTPPETMGIVPTITVRLLPLSSAPSCIWSQDP